MPLCSTCGLDNAPDLRICRACGAPLEAAELPPNVLRPGTRLLDGSYTTGKVLGQGGFGITYLGSDARLARPVAIKELFPAGCARQSPTVVPAGGWTVPSFEDARIRFLEEARTLARFSHPGVVHVYAAFEAHNTAYMVMEYLDGRDLAALLQERGGRLPEAEAVSLIERVGNALDVIHEAGLLHRDLKPENVMLCPGGRAVLIDFGAAKEYVSGKTQRHSLTLTPGYAPLEQYAPRAKRGPYTDVYALAALLYHLLAGEVPPTATDRAAGVEIPTLRTLAPETGAVTERAVMQALEMDAGRRPQTAAAFLAALHGRSACHTLPSAPPAHPALLRRLQGPARPVGRVALSPDGRNVAAGSADGAVWLWDAESGILQASLSGHSDWPRALAFAPDGRALAIGCWDGSISLWNGRSESLPPALASHGRWLYALDFAPDGHTLLSAGADRALKLWDAHTGRLVRIFRGHADWVRAAAFSMAGETLVSGSDDGTVRLWETRTGRALRVLDCRGRVHAAALSPDGQVAAAGCEDGVLRLWEVKSNRLWRSLPAHAGSVRAIAFSPDGAWLATAGADGAIHLWRPLSGRHVETFTGHAGWIASLCFSPDGRQLVSGGWDSVVRAWNV